MIWTVKYEAEMDTNDANYVESHGELGDFDDTNVYDMKQLAMLTTALSLCSARFDDGGCDYEDVTELAEKMKEDEDLLKLVTEKEIDIFCEQDVGDIWDFLSEYKPSDPNDDSKAHDLYFTFTRIPADIKEEELDFDWVVENVKKASTNVDKSKAIFVITFIVIMILLFYKLLF